MNKFNSLNFIHLDSGSVKEIPITSIASPEKLRKQANKLMDIFTYEYAELETGNLFCLYQDIPHKRIPLLTCGCSNNYNHYREIWQPLSEVYLQPKIDIPPLPYIAVRWEYSNLVSDEIYKKASIFSFVLGCLFLLKK